MNPHLTTEFRTILALSALFLVAFANSADAQQPIVPPAGHRTSGACSDRKKAVAAVPKGVMDKLNEAFYRQDFEEAVRIARSPLSGLRVASIRRDEKGRIATLWIVAHNGCTVMMKGPARANRPF